MSELSQAEWAVLEAAIEDGAIADSNPDKALVQGAERGWLAARFHYAVGGLSAALMQAEERERALREEIESAASDASLCDSAEKLEGLTVRLLSIAGNGGGGVPQ